MYVYVRVCVFFWVTWHKKGQHYQKIDSSVRHTQTEWKKGRVNRYLRCLKMALGLDCAWTATAVIVSHTHLESMNNQTTFII